MSFLWAVLPEGLAIAAARTAELASPAGLPHVPHVLQHLPKASHFLHQGRDVDTNNRKRGAHKYAVGAVRAHGHGGLPSSLGPGFDGAQFVFAHGIAPSSK